MKERGINESDAWDRGEWRKKSAPTTQIKLELKLEEEKEEFGMMSQLILANLNWKAKHYLY